MCVRGELDSTEKKIAQIYGLYLKELMVIQVVARIKFKDELVVDPRLCPHVHVDTKQAGKHRCQEETSVRQQETVPVWQFLLYIL